MNAVLRLYKASENWMLKAYDRHFQDPVYRSLITWGLTILFLLTFVGGLDTLHRSWFSLSEKARLGLAMSLLWCVIPWVRSVQLQVKFRRIFHQGRAVADHERTLYRESVTSSILSVLAVCGAVNGLLKVVSDNLR